MIGKQGLGLGVLLGLFVASAQSGCGRSASQTGEPDPDGQASGGDAPVPTSGSSAVGVGGEAPLEGGSGGVSTDAGAGGANVVDGGEPGVGEACQPVGRSCDGPSIRVCSADGQSTIEKTCLPSEVCSQAECRPIVCVPNKEFCRDGAIHACGEDGTTSNLVEKCAESEFCREDDGVVGCNATACEPEEALCNGSIATICKSDGSGPKAGGKDCSHSDRLCNDGACVDPTCTPGQKLCEHDDVYLCIGGGVDSVLFTDCTLNEVCDPSVAACRTRICEPGKLGCDSTRTVTCNALGTGWEQGGVDCAATDKICVAGSCKSRVCSPNAQFCQDGDVYQCDANGVQPTLREACNDAYYHCVSYSSSYAYCTSNACTPGTPTCSGNMLSTCAADGSGPQAGGTDCGDKVCSGNACLPKVCDAYSYFCQNDDIYYCGSNSLNSQFGTSCAEDAPCAKTEAGAACVPYKCWPGLKSCLDNKVGTCAQDGKSLASVKEDCATADQVCVSTSACGATAVDTLGEPNELASIGDSFFFGDVIEVHSNRLLTGLEANLVLAGSRDLRWAVFELVSGYYVSRYEKVLNGQTGSGYLSSGSLSYVLKAGKTYLLGVAVSGGGVAPYYDSIPWQPEVSFGKVAGSYSQNYSTQMYGYYGSTSLVYDLRITTSAP